METQQAQVAQLQAAIKADEALIEAAKVQLSYTKLTSPIDGVADPAVDIGNIIHPTDTNGLVIVTQIEPISLIFTLPETDLPQIRDQQQKTPTPFRVLAYSQGNTISWMKARSASSITRSCRRPVRFSSRRISQQGASAVAG